MIDKLKVLGQPMTSELRFKTWALFLSSKFWAELKTQKSEKCDFADNFISEQARVAI